MLFSVLVSVPVHTHRNTLGSVFSHRQVPLFFFFFLIEVVGRQLYLEIIWARKMLLSQVLVGGLVCGGFPKQPYCSDAPLGTQYSYMECETHPSETAEMHLRGWGARRSSGSLCLRAERIQREAK